MLAAQLQNIVKTTELHVKMANFMAWEFYLRKPVSYKRDEQTVDALTT